METLHACNKTHEVAMKYSFYIIIAMYVHARLLVNKEKSLHQLHIYVSMYTDY